MQEFRFERKISIKRDIREPRFLKVNNTLFPYFAVPGTNLIKFEPEETMSIYLNDKSVWSRPEWLFKNTFIPWRGKIFNNTPTLIGYPGGDNIYSEPSDLIKVFWYRTLNGKNFEPFIENTPVILTGGVPDTDIVKIDENEYIAVSRNELGDEDGLGSKICRIKTENQVRVNCISNLKKYDSPLPDFDS